MIGTIARVFAPSENGVPPLKTAVEVESNLITEYKSKLKIDHFPIPDPLKIPHGWMEEDEGMAFWPIRPSGAKGGRGGVSLPPKFSVDVPFFADESFNCALFETSNQKCA